MPQPTIACLQIWYVFRQQTPFNPFCCQPSLKASWLIQGGFRVQGRETNKTLTSITNNQTWITEKHWKFPLCVSRTNSCFQRFKLERSELTPPSTNCTESPFWLKCFRQIKTSGCKMDVPDFGNILENVDLPSAVRFNEYPVKHSSTVSAYKCSKSMIWHHPIINYTLWSLCIATSSCLSPCSSLSCSYCLFLTLLPLETTTYISTGVFSSLSIVVLTDCWLFIHLKCVSPAESRLSSLTLLCFRSYLKLLTHSARPHRSMVLLQAKPQCKCSPSWFLHNNVCYHWMNEMHCWASWNADCFAGIWRQKSNFEILIWWWCYRNSWYFTKKPLMLTHGENLLVCQPHWDMHLCAFVAIDSIVFKNI